MHFEHVWYQDPPELQSFVTVSQCYNFIAGYLLVKINVLRAKSTTPREIIIENLY